MIFIWGKTISLYRNKIQVIEDGTFSGLDKLKTLVLSQNNISELSEGMFTGLISLQTLYLQGNRLATISSDAFSQLYRPFTLVLSDSRIPASQRNPLQCNTDLCWLKQELVDRTIYLDTRYNHFKHILCSNGGNWDTWTCNPEGE